MANFVFVISKGRIAEFSERVNNNDPATSRFVIVPLEASGLEAQAALEDSLTLAEVLDGTTNEQTTMGRKYLTDSDLGVLLYDTTNNWMDVDMPDITWSNATGNAVGALCLAYDPSAGADTTIIPMGHFDFAVTPDGTDITAVVNAEGFYRAT
jgi:hypothetical protein